jgi:hypothetical protein
LPKPTILTNNISSSLNSLKSYSPIQCVVNCNWKVDFEKLGYAKELVKNAYFDHCPINIKLIKFDEDVCKSFFYFIPESNFDIYTIKPSIALQ